LNLFAHLIYLRKFYFICGQIIFIQDKVIKNNQSSPAKKFVKGRKEKFFRKENLSDRKGEGKENG